MSFTETFALAIATYLLVVTPGPCTLAVFARSASDGLSAGILLSIGVVAGDVLYLGIALASWGAIAETLAPVMTYVRYIGAGYIVFLGYKQCVAPLAVAAACNVTKKERLRTIAIGFVISGTNPKVIVFYLSFLPLFIDLAAMQLYTALQTVVTITTAVFAALCTVALVGRCVGTYGTTQARMRTVNRISGCFMIAVGIGVALTGLT